MVTPEDRLHLREICSRALDQHGWAALIDEIARAVPTVGTREQAEAYCMAYFDVLMSRLLDARNRILADLRRV